MPARLVYSPRVYAYTKDQAGVLHNLSPWIVSGQVQRKINQVSSAEITLRNPYKRFTTPSQGVAFHPMDPVTIYLERLAGYPVRVFTGYLDTTPYYQMYPGTITLQASCTLKRLLYTYFDPSLPYVMAFFAKYDWINTGTGTIISGKMLDGQAPTQADVNAGRKPFTNLQDGSLGKLLWATLHDIGEWKDSHIYIEDLPGGPNGIAARMAQLMSSIQKEQQQASDDFTTFLENIIGSSAQGSGGGTGQGTGQAWLVPASAEDDPPGASAACGPLPNDRRGYSVLSVSGTSHDPGTAGQALSPGKVWPCGTQLVITNPNNKKSVTTKLVDVGSGSDAILPVIGLYPQTRADLGWDGSSKVIIQLAGAGPALNPVRGTKVNDPASQVGGSIGQAANNAATAIVQNATGSGTTSSGYHNPFEKAHNVVGERVDMGVDYRCDPGSPIVAIGDSQFLHSHEFYAGQPILTFKILNGNLAGQVYYYSEGVNPPNYGEGKTFKGGEVVTTTTSQPTGLEFGWATADGMEALAHSHYSEGNKTPEGYMFDRLMVALGAPASSDGNGGSGPVAPNGVTANQISAAAPSPGGGTTGAATDVTNKAQAFVTELEFPSIEDSVAAIALGAEHKGLMHDQVLLTFVQQVAQASLRSFQSLPDGSFYGFYPDYFGEMGHHKPYWLIKDIEILDGGINLSDDALATHVFAVGDNTMLGTNLLGGGGGNSELINQLFSAGTITIFNAFLGTNILDNSISGKKSKGMANIMNEEEAVKFIERYGARPLVQDYPMVRSSIFEMLLAYQQFMLAWSNQFKTPFTFTFMPELYPGGKVGFPDHGIQMYINSVTHSWNYQEGGFTTTAELSAPSLLEGVNAANFPDIPPHMVQAMVEPVRQKSGKPAQTTSQKAAQQTANIVDQGINQVLTGVENVLGIGG